MPNNNTKKVFVMPKFVQRQVMRKGKKKGPKKQPKIARKIMARVDPFVSCFMAPTMAKIGRFRGIPDSNSGNTVDQEHLSVFTIKPNAAGIIQFAIVPCAIGGFALKAGQMTATIWDVNTNAWVSYAISTDAAGWGTGNYMVIPFPEYTKGNPLTSDGSGTTSQNQATFYSDRWRCAASKGSVCYVGDWLYNAGAIHTGRQAITTSDVSYDATTTVPNVPTGTFFQITDNGPSGTAAIATLPDYARSSFSKTPEIDLNNLHTGVFKFEPFREGFVPTNKGGTTEPAGAGDCPFAQLGINGSTGKFQALPMPGLSSMTSSFVSIEGMDTTTPQAVSVVVKNCLEYSVAATSTFARIAQESPPENPVALKQVIDMGKKLPSMLDSGRANECGWWCMAKGYAGAAADVASFGAEFVPYLGQGVRGVRALTSAFQSMGGGNALAGVSKYAIGY